MNFHFLNHFFCVWWSWQTNKPQLGSQILAWTIKDLIAYHIHSFIQLLQNKTKQKNYLLSNRTNYFLLFSTSPFYCVDIHISFRHSTIRCCGCCWNSHANAKHRMLNRLYSRSQSKGYRYSILGYTHLTMKGRLIPTIGLFTVVYGEYKFYNKSEWAGLLSAYTNSVWCLLLFSWTDTKKLRATSQSMYWMAREQSRHVQNTIKTAS